MPAMLLGAALSCGLQGCANPGQPKPPSLRLPEKATKVAAERLGDQVILTWTTPVNTTDGDAIRGPVEAVICREEANRRPSGQPVCMAVLHVAATPGPGRAAETLPPNLATGNPVLLTYRVELLNQHQRSAGPSAAVYAAGGSSPAPTGPLTIRASRDGALIRWASDDRGAPMYLTRTLLTLSGPAVKPTKEKNLNFGSPSTEPAIVMLRPASTAANPGGMLDRSVRDQAAYTYVGQRVQTVVLSGHSLELRGLPSPPVSFTFVNTFPPVPPVGLVSVPGGGFGEPPSIELSWEPSPENDVLGYYVYRSEAGSGFVRVTPEPVTAAAFRDLHVELGRTYTYRVTAIDQRQNESAPGSEVHETLRK